jgi:hypothetical protein
MRECSYQLYVAIYQAVRQGIASGDADIIRRVSMHLAGRDGVTSLVMTLAIIDAKRGDPERSKEDVCGDVRCDGPCAVWAGADGRRGGGSGGPRW